MEEKREQPASRVEEFLQTNKFSVFLALVGIIILGIGLLGTKMLFSSESSIEILTQETQEATAEKGTIFVDLAGAVQNPGVYELKANSRINNLLIAAGGLSVKADREWVSRNMNLAQKLTDGAKIYIPEQSEVASGSLNSPSSVAGVTTGLININTASASQLDTLWGIGPATAEKIISSRPYQFTDELRTKKIVKSNVWEAIKDKITVY